MARTRILIVDDERGVRESCAEILQGLPDTEVVLEGESPRAAQRLRSEDFDLLISDIRMPEMSGIDLLRIARKTDPGISVLVLTGFPTVESAVECMKLGASDYLTKPFQPESLLTSVCSLLSNKRLRDENRFLRRQVERNYCCGTILGRSAAMVKVCERIQRTAETDFDVLIVGETGTGKELVAHAIHNRSARKNGPFVPVNCGAIPDDLLESEFFGHERGAFTGAQTRSLGLFEYADHGTFFLDELNQLPMRLQGKLLRVLQERRIRRVGATKETDVHVRVVAASSVSLEEEVQQGRFRPDLYHRINVAQIDLPPLRDRAEDIPLLVNTFIERYAGELGKESVRLDPEVMEVLVSYRWPGNVRELQNVLKRALAWSRQDVITLEDLPDDIVSRAGDFSRKSGTGFFQQRERHLASFETEFFSALLDRCDGDVSAAAREAQLPRGTLYRLLKKHRLDPSGFREEKKAPA